jgi:signal transduction histidine kinase
LPGRFPQWVFGERIRMQEKTKINLLLVDDHPDNLIAMRAVLEELGENIITVDSGKKALRLLLDQEFAIVLLDVDMPLMDGFEVAEMMRQVKKLQHTPVIFLTAMHQNESHVYKGYSLGAVDYLFKPFEPEILKAKVRFFIDLYRKTAEIQYQAALLAETNYKLDQLNLDLERKVKERTSQLQRAVEEAQKANRLKDEFLATLSHELRTPMNSILGWIKLLNSGSLNSETSARAFETIERNAKMQAQLIEDILDVSRIITGKLQLQMQPVAMDTIVHTAAEILLPAINAKNIKFQIDVEQGILPVLGEPTRLQQVVWNLLSNAVKFTPSLGEITLSLQQKDSTVQLQVRDNGQGIAPAFLPYIFDRFRQADGSTTRRQGGLGLGLSIVQRVVELHQGTVRAESAGEGKGATFTLELPLVTVRPLSNATREPAVTERNYLSDKHLPNLDNVEVLVVDDQEDTRELICFILQQCHAHTRAAGSAKEAWAILQEWQPSVLVSDLGMPEEDGHSLIKRIRLLWQENYIPALALTGYALDDERKRALENGFQAYLTKPVNEEDLVTTIARLAHNRIPADKQETLV